MGFKMKMAEVSADDLKKIRDERPTGRYDGPTPPPGIYQAKIDKVWYAETKKGDPCVKASFQISEPTDSENAVYNGASTIQNFMVPVDPTSKAFVVQVSQLEDLLGALSNGKMDYRDFQKVGEEGRSDVGEEDKIGHPVKQIGSVKITGETLVKIKTKVREYNGNEYIEIHYILREDKSDDTSSSSDLDLDDDEDLDDLDDLLGV